MNFICNPIRSLFTRKLHWKRCVPSNTKPLQKEGGPPPGPGWIQTATEMTLLELNQPPIFLQCINIKNLVPHPMYKIAQPVTAQSFKLTVTNCDISKLTSMSMASMLNFHKIFALWVSCLTMVSLFEIWYVTVKVHCIMWYDSLRVFRSPCFMLGAMVCGVFWWFLAFLYILMVKPCTLSYIEIFACKVPVCSIRKTFFNYNCT